MTIDLAAARAEKARYDRNAPKPAKTESRLVLTEPWREAPSHEPRVKFLTERPYLPKNRRYKRFGTI